MNILNHEDHVSRARNFIHHGNEPLNRAGGGRARKQSGNIHAHQTLIAQTARHIAFNHFVGQALNDTAFTHAVRAGQNHIGRAAVNHPKNFFKFFFARHAIIKIIQLCHARHVIGKII